MQKIQLIKTVRDWKEEARTLKFQNINEERYGSANYYMGKEQALKEVIDLLLDIKEHNIAYDLK